MVNVAVEIIITVARYLAADYCRHEFGAGNCPSVPLLGCDLRLLTRDGDEISDDGGALCSAVSEANLSQQRRTLDRDERNAIGTNATHGLWYKRDAEAGGYHRNRRRHLRRLLGKLRTESGTDKSCENGVVDRWINCACE